MLVRYRQRRVLVVSLLSITHKVNVAIACVTKLTKETVPIIFLYILSPTDSGSSFDLNLDALHCPQEVPWFQSRGQTLT
ncbi:hypothetical protein Bpfe_030817, partial [Biomphalaria pfeifferi]